MAISIPRWTGMLRRAGAPARAATEIATEIATEVDQTVDALVSQHEYDSAFERLLYTMQLGFPTSGRALSTNGRPLRAGRRPHGCHGSPARGQLQQANLDRPRDRP